jgi:thiamine-monophosphate kinase
VWIGDDTAVVIPAAGGLLVSVDAAVEGVHADLALVGLDDLGWRAVSTAVSDIAAMGGCADRLVVAVAAPPSLDLELLYSGITAAALHHGAAVVGGDLSTATQIVVTVTVLGHVPGGGPPVLRSGAEAGDALVVTGPLGAAAAGLRILRDESPSPSTDSASVRALTGAHRRPVARLAEGEVARASGATAMIDLSDGIASDVRRLAIASQVGARLHGLPVAAGATEREALCGGDDYELLFSVADAESAIKAFETARLRTPVVVGVCTTDPSELRLGDRPLPECGWEHPFELPD